MVAQDFAFRGILAANRLPKYRDHGPGRGPGGTNRTERHARGPDARGQRAAAVVQLSWCSISAGAEAPGSTVRLLAPRPDQRRSQSRPKTGSTSGTKP